MMPAPPTPTRWPLHPTDPLVACIILLAISSAIFLAFPALDIWVSSFFYEPGAGFPASRIPALLALRSAHETVTWMVPVALVLSMMARVAFPRRPSIVPPRNGLFILGALALGPGLVANLVFKNNWGRPRPTGVDLFLGDHPFVGAWHFSDACARNCSFVSGEASSAVWLLTFVVLLPERWRRTGIAIIAVIAIALSLNRIAFGGHFLSDVIIAWWLTLAVILVLHRIMYGTPEADAAAARLDANLAAAGVAVRRLFRAA
jgi:membrane-associated PAP2 superfamily phosphatase